ncbi:MAG: PIN domain-containing protein [archaeon]
MIELFRSLPRITLDEKVDYLIDTCFLIYTFENHKEKKLKKLMKKKKFAITSFNVEEYLFIHNHVHNDINIAIRKFLKKNKIPILTVPVHPGNMKMERSFAKSTIPELNTNEHDPSDAVILAAAIHVGADVLTRDKHDMFNARMENFLHLYEVKVFNRFADIS